MKSCLNSTKWKTDPRAAYIPPAMIAFVFVFMFAVSAPAWSFETYHAHINEHTAEISAQPQSVSVRKQDRRAAYKKPSPAPMDTCTPLLSSSHPAHMDRTQRSAGKAAAIGLVFGVRFALTPPKKAHAGVVSGPQLDVWQPKAALASDRTALAVAAYRECQKSQALQALNSFRWKR